MKKNFLLIILSAVITVMLLAFSYKASPKTATVIGTYSGTTYTITYDLGDMESQWETALQNGGISAELSGFEITYDADNSQYLVVAADASQDLKTAIPLEDAGEGNLIEKLIDGAGLVVTCSGCATECHPQIILEKGYCSPPCPPGKTCTKSETLSSGGGNFTN